MRNPRLQLFACVAVLSGAVACGGSSERGGTPGAEGTAGTAEQGMTTKAGGTVLTGCLAKNTRTGQFELVLQGDDARRAGDESRGMQPGHDRLTLVAGRDVELNQHVGKRVTVRGALGAGQPVSDAGTRSYGAGEGADPSQTRSREGDSRQMTVQSITEASGECSIEDR